MIRRLTESDAVAFRALRLRALREHPEAYGSSYEEETAKPLTFFAARAKGSEDAHLFGAWREDQLVAVTALVRESQIKTRHKANIFSVYVAPEARGQGVAKALLAAATKTALGLGGISHLYLSVTSHNQAAKTLYQGLGFEPYGVEPAALSINGEFFDEVLMCKQLK